MIKDNKIWIGQADEPVFILPKMANRHGLITGATGTGKTVTLKTLAEGFSEIGVPTFLADIKGDVSGLAAAGKESSLIEERKVAFGMDSFEYQAFPTTFWDIYGEGGHPVRTTVSEMGPLLLSKLMGLNETQSSVLTIIFKIADENGLLLLDIKDLKSILDYVYSHNKKLEAEYGLLSSSTISAITRNVLAFEQEGADVFFGETALDLTDWLRVDASGKGMINILHAVKLFHSPSLYATFLLWMLTELFETLPEVGDMEKPKMVFFFDEAHLLFKDMPKALVDKIELVVKLIRSKGIGVYFITQNPQDIPNEILSQLGNRIQHALRAYTPSEQKAVKAAAQSFRANENFDTEKVITELGTGEALISTLDEKGVPSVVQQAIVIACQSSFDELPASERSAIIAASPFASKYSNQVDRESAYEILMVRKQTELAEQEATALAEARAKEVIVKEKAAKPKRTKKTAMEKSVDTALTTIGREVGKSITRGVLGMFKGFK